MISLVSVEAEVLLAVSEAFPQKLLVYCKTPRRKTSRKKLNCSRGKMESISVICSFLANDVTLVMSYGYCQSLKINGVRIYDRLSYGLWGWGHILWDDGWGCAPGQWNCYLISGTYPYSLHYGSTPGLWSVLHWRVSINRNYLIFLRIRTDIYRNYSLGAPVECAFCILEVWQDFIRTVVLRLLSRGANFHSIKNIRNYTQDGLVNFRFHT